MLAIAVARRPVCRARSASPPRCHAYSSPAPSPPAGRRPSAPTSGRTRPLHTPETCPGTPSAGPLAPRDIASLMVCLLCTVAVCEWCPLDLSPGCDEAMGRWPSWLHRAPVVPGEATALTSHDARDIPNCSPACGGGLARR